MAFCVNCGQQLGEGAKFCTNCGQTVTSHKTENSERKTVYDGEIHKCPNCGEIIDAFVTNCPACDYEIRGSKATVWQTNGLMAMDWCESAVTAAGKAEL